MTAESIDSLSSPPAHDRDEMLICRNCGHGLTAAEVLDGETACPSPPGFPDDLHTALARVIAGGEETDAPVLVDADHIADTILASRAVSVRLLGTVTEPTVEEWAAQMDAERTRQIEHGYDDAHDAEHGIAHLLNWSIDYARRGNTIAAATLARCALHLPRGTVTDTARVLADPQGGCACDPFDQDAGGGYTEHLLEYEPDCPVHSKHLYDPRIGQWIMREKFEAAQGARVSAENTTPTNHENRSNDA